MNSPIMFCQKAMIVNAIRYKKNNLKAVLEFTGKHPNFDNWFKTFEDYEMHVHMDGDRFKVFGPGGTEQIAMLGDYIIKDNSGIIYVLNPATFSLLYVPI